MEEDLDLSDCCYRSESSSAIISANSFWIEGIAIILIGIPGIVGNLLSIIVLSMRSMRNVFHTLLVCLALVDLLLISLAILDYSLVRAFDIHFNWYFLAFPSLIYPLTNIVFTGSIFVVVAIAYERYTAVCNPYDYRATVNTQSTRSRVGKLLTPVIFMSVAINIPKFFETYTVEMLQPVVMSSDAFGNGNNSVVDNELRLGYNVTSLRRDPTYITFYVNWFLLISTGLVPMAALIFFNSRIYAKILETRRLRERCRIRSSTVMVLQNRNKVNAKADNNAGETNGQTNASPPPTAETQAILPMECKEDEANHNNQDVSAANNQPKRHEAMSPKDFKMARVLLSIVLVFFICHLPRVVLSIMEFTMAAKVERCGDAFCPPMLLMCAVPISHFMLVLNSSVNIIIYCVLGEGFRAGLRQSLKRSTGHMTRNGANGEKDGNQGPSGPKTFARLRSRSPTRGTKSHHSPLDLLQVPLAGGDERRMSLGGFDSTIATDFTRASSRNNIREAGEVDIEMVQIQLQITPFSVGTSMGEKKNKGEPADLEAASDNGEAVPVIENN